MSFKDSSTHTQQKDSVSDEALTAIVISQRERFRIRNVELENVIQSLKYLPMNDSFGFFF
jgi:hypothetical protein